MACRLRVEKFLSRHIATVLEPLLKLEDAEELAGIERGIAFRLVESMGVVSREEIAEDVKALSQEDRAALRRHGVRFGAFHVFIPVLLKPAATSLRLLLWGLGLEQATAGSIIENLAAGARPGPDLGFLRPLHAARISTALRLSHLRRARACASTCSSGSPTSFASGCSGGPASPTRRGRRARSRAAALPLSPT